MLCEALGCVALPDPTCPTGTQTLFLFLPSPFSISLLPREAGVGGSCTEVSVSGQIEDIFGKNDPLWVIPACWALTGSVTTKITWLLTAAPAK